jgi:hypothetical protein
MSTDLLVRIHIAGPALGEHCGHCPCQDVERYIDGDVFFCGIFRRPLAHANGVSPRGLSSRLPECMEAERTARAHPGFGRACGEVQP